MQAEINAEKIKQLEGQDVSEEKELNRKLADLKKALGLTYI